MNITQNMQERNKKQQQHSMHSVNDVVYLLKKVRHIRNRYLLLDVLNVNYIVVMFICVS